MVSKNYRDFRLQVARENGVINRKLSLVERSRLWLWIAGPQAALYFSAMVLASAAPVELMRGLVFPLAAAKYLWAGPYGVALALKADYRRFRIQ